ncbi:MAG: hypothetical protein WBA61_13575 [Aequorivita sp.]
MKNYTFHFLVLTLVTGILGYSGWEFPGAKPVRIICLFAFIALMISCLDSLMVIRKKRMIKKSSSLKN